MHIIGWVLFGLIVGLVAKMLMPGRDPGGMIVTILLGVAGSVIGGYLGSTFGGGAGTPAGWIGSIGCAMLLLLVYRMIMHRPKHP